MEKGTTEADLPELLRRAIAANDRAKYYLSLLQFAVAAADEGDEAAVDLAEDRVGAGIDDASLDRVVRGARCVGEGLYHVPHARRIVAAVVVDLDVMIAALRAAPVEASRRIGQQLGARLRRFAPEYLTRTPEVIDLEQLARVAGWDERSDTLHALIMDVHRALNELDGRASP